jgi:hypothetical protein
LGLLALIESSTYCKSLVIKIFLNCYFDIIGLILNLTP